MNAPCPREGGDPSPVGANLNRSMMDPRLRGGTHLTEGISQEMEDLRLANRHGVTQFPGFGLRLNLLHE